MNISRDSVKVTDNKQAHILFAQTLNLKTISSLSWSI